MRSGPVRTILTILMDILIACAIALTLRLGVEFFGNLAAQDWGKAIVAFTNPLVIPFGLDSIKTPYGGIFEVEAALMIGLLIVVEWFLSAMRDRG